MILLIGKSGSGKSWIERDLVECGYKRIISYTSRPMRSNEKNGVDYHFVSKDEFAKLLKQDYFAEWTLYNDWYYGLPKNECTDDKVAVVNPVGFRQLIRCNNLNIISFYIDVNDRNRIKRMIDRGDNLIEIFRRYLSDDGAFYGIDREVNYVVKNDDFNGIHEILRILMEVENVHI